MTGDPTATDRRTLGWRDHSRHAAVAAHQEYVLSFRNRWIPGLAGLFLLFATMLVLFGGSRVGPTRPGPLVASLASLATYLVPLAAVAYGYDVVVGAAERGWLGVLFALPLPRAAVLLGRFLGRVAGFATALAAGFGVAGAVLVAGVGPGVLPVYGTLVVGAVGLGATFLGLGALVSTLAPQKTHALGAGLLAWVWFVLVHDLVALGLVAAADLGGTALTMVLLANPVDIFRVLVLADAGATAGGFASVFAATGLSTPLLGAALVVWSVVPAIGAAALVGRRSV